MSAFSRYSVFVNLRRYSIYFELNRGANNQNLKDFKTALTFILKITINCESLYYILLLIYKILACTVQCKSIHTIHDTRAWVRVYIWYIEYFFMFKIFITIVYYQLFVILTTTRVFLVVKYFIVISCEMIES